MGVCVGGIGVKVAGMSVEIGVPEGATVEAGVGPAQAVMNNRRMAIFWRMDIFYPFVYNAVIRPDSSTDRTRHS